MDLVTTRLRWPISLQERQFGHGVVKTETPPPLLSIGCTGLSNGLQRPRSHQPLEPTNARGQSPAGPPLGIGFDTAPAQRPSTAKVQSLHHKAPRTASVGETLSTGKENRCHTTIPPTRGIQEPEQRPAEQCSKNRQRLKAQVATSSNMTGLSPRLGKQRTQVESSTQQPNKSNRVAPQAERPKTAVSSAIVAAQTQLKYKKMLMS